VSVSVDPFAPALETRVPRAFAYAPVPPVTVPVVVGAPGVTLACIVRVPSRRTRMPEQVMTDLRKFEAPIVVVQLTWSLPTTRFDESASGFVNANTSPSEFDCGDFVFVLRMWMKVEPFSSSVNVSVRPYERGGFLDTTPVFHFIFVREDGALRIEHIDGSF
jgi:hypothetical protein